ncbi:MAG: hypothetical protein OEY87_06285 [Gammaproteobacteria bacterium]|nr:hypothetical protein [Gammaproteobacteria bacterium]MDH5735714.1 hypothetical protein [Gammaproteobacteria bacterium]
MINEKIKVRATENDQIIEVLVYSKKADHIEVMVGEGAHSIKCQLTPTHNGMAYVGNVMGREIVYERSRQQVQTDLDNAKPSTRRR